MCLASSETGSDEHNARDESVAGDNKRSGEGGIQPTHSIKRRRTKTLNVAIQPRVDVLKILLSTVIEEDQIIVMA